MVDLYLILPSVKQDYYYESVKVLAFNAYLASASYNQNGECAVGGGGGVLD